MLGEAAQWFENAFIDHGVAVADNWVVAAPMFGQIETALQGGKLVIVTLPLRYTHDRPTAGQQTALMPEVIVVVLLVE
ncbi:hypothetical protein D3C86_2015580 [compost metagenome]